MNAPVQHNRGRSATTFGLDLMLIRDAWIRRSESHEGRGRRRMKKKKKKKKSRKMKRRSEEKEVEKSRSGRREAEQPGGLLVGSRLSVT